jgi:hypothetical protein
MAGRLRDWHKIFLLCFRETSLAFEVVTLYHKIGSENRQQIALNLWVEVRPKYVYQ